MPQMVALFNGVGGGAAALVSLAEFHNLAPELRGQVGCTATSRVAIVLSALIGSVSFAGSMVAFAKLQELIQGRPITYPGQQFVNLLLFAAIVAAGDRDRRRRRGAVAARRGRSAARSSSACCSCCRSAAPTCRS